MQCQECKHNEANIHIIKSVNGKQTELFLCEHCARKKEELDFSFEPQFSLHKLFGGILKQNILGGRGTTPEADLQCPSCGLSFSQFSQIGRIGCSGCFAAFEQRLKPLLRRIHSGCVHTGKIPLRLQVRVKALREIDELKERLQQKIQNEEFEDAAVLRDRIRALEQEVQGPAEAEPPAPRGGEGGAVGRPGPEPGQTDSRRNSIESDGHPLQGEDIKKAEDGDGREDGGEK